ncbi:hypothetical protein [Methanobacterium sp.]|uniref:hypothetical protein n=1 Tax=Methanobacterium sp. TaxID=2164 RepID=UPI002AB805A9|nr:hypothetical protein [Methanobacterium sp.]MDY9924399.1 hypothetical protein [Methanobacterium sp.]
MTKKEIYLLKIKKELKNSSYNLETLYKKVKGIKKFNSRDTPFYSALMELILENKVFVNGYDFDVHNVKDDRIQSFKKNGVKLEWIKTEQTDVLLLLNLLESSDPNKVKEAKKKLIEYFNRKIEQFEKQEIEFWEMMKSNVLSMPLKDAIKDLNYELESLETKNPENKLVTHQKNDLIKRKAYFQKYYDKNKNLNVWYFDKLTKQDLHKSLNIELSKNNPKPRELGNNSIILGRTLEERPYTTYEAARMIERSSFPVIANRENWGSEDFLKEKNIYKPKKMSSEEKRTHFNKLLFFVNTHENYNFMKNSFALALSDEEDSSDWFDLFIKKISYIKTLRDKLVMELSFEEYINPYAKKSAELRQQLERQGTN